MPNSSHARAATAAVMIPTTGKKFIHDFPPPLVSRFVDRVLLGDNESASFMGDGSEIISAV
ncbi:MAG: hypothetical protein WCT12_29630 [Verrucomicrobiota bacterium]